MIDLLLVGYVTKPHGLKGEVVVEPHHGASPLWKAGITLHAVTRGAAEAATDRLVATPIASYLVRSCRKLMTGGDIRWVCGFDGVTTREGADALVGTHFGVDPTLVPAPADDEFYHHELRGYAVLDVHGVVLGTLVGVMPGPAQDLLEVQPPDPKADTWFVPFVSAIVGDVDRVRRTIVIDPPEGLIP